MGKGKTFSTSYDTVLACGKKLTSFKVIGRTQISFLSLLIVFWLRAVDKAGYRHCF